MIRGFALNLALGIYISMFSAIVITQGLMKYHNPSKETLAKWFNLKSNYQHKTFKFIENQKFTSAISIILVIFSLFSVSIKGLNLGVDFTGGSVLEIASSKNITQEQLQGTLNSFNQEKDLKSAHAITINNNAFQIKSDYLSKLMRCPLEWI